MSNTYLNYVEKRPHGSQPTPQSRAIPGRESEMKRNNAGGVTFVLDKWGYLERFLILGSEGGTYYVSEGKLTVDNLYNVLACLKEDGIKAVDTVIEISDSGRAPKNTPAIFVMAMAMSPNFANANTRRYAAENLWKVCRIGTHILEFADIIQAFRGWGKLVRKAVGNWFTEKDTDQLALQAVKYSQRGGFALRDLLRLSHPVVDMKDIDRRTVLQYISHPEDIELSKGLDTPVNEGNYVINISPMPKKVKTSNGYVNETRREFQYKRLPRLLDGTMQLKNADPSRAAELIEQYRLPREAVPTNLLNRVDVWEALLKDMPITALIRNLGKMSSIGLIAPNSDAAKYAVNILSDINRIKRGRVHPIQFLSAYMTYKQGHGFKGRLSWNPVPQVTDALERGFYKAFQAVEPSNKNFYLGIDISGSMTMDWGGGLGALNMKCSQAAGAMALTIMNVEPWTYAAGFNHQMVDLKINPSDSLSTVFRKVQGPFGRTDCAMPMLDAAEKKIKADMFVILTDNETWAGNIQPVEALKRYRDKMGIPAKLVVVGMTSTGFTIADPKDSGMLDVVGFDTNVPRLISNFAK